MNIMIVDDNARMREVLRDTVSSGDDAVLECSDGAEAVDRFPAFRPDVVLMDIEMKGMDGFAAAERIYAMDPTARIFFVSSHNTSAFRLKATMLHCAGYVTKDNLSELTHIVRRSSP